MDGDALSFNLCVCGTPSGKQMAQPKELRYRQDDLVLSQSKKLSQGRDGYVENLPTKWSDMVDKLRFVLV